MFVHCAAQCLAYLQNQENFQIDLSSGGWITLNKEKGV